MSATPSLSTADDLLVCTACGAQYDVTSLSKKSECRICDDPRQFVPPTGQSFTTLAQMRKDGYKNQFRQDPADERVWEIWTEPKFAIGQRACLLQTPHGNVLWDLIALLDQETVDKIKFLGGLEMIVISHPHFYTTWADWSVTFRCPVYMSSADHIWANRIPPSLQTPAQAPPSPSPPSRQRPASSSNSSLSTTTTPTPTLCLLTSPVTTLLPSITAIICGGHFPGSTILHSSASHSPSLFVADALVAVPSAHNPDPAKPGVTSYSFMWSIPNCIPLPPGDIVRIWEAIKPLEFVATYGVFAGGSNVREMIGGGQGQGQGQGQQQRTSLKERVLESAKIAVRAMGYVDHAIMRERVE